MDFVVYVPFLVDIVLHLQCYSILNSYIHILILQETAGDLSNPRFRFSIKISSF